MSNLRKSSSDKMVFGVCGGIAEYFGWDPTLVRVIFVVLTFAGIGSPVLIYLLLALIMPN